jgi:hypothetical protein
MKEKEILMVSNKYGDRYVLPVSAQFQQSTESTDDMLKASRNHVGMWSGKD